MVAEAPESEAVVKTSWKPMSEVLAQLASVTGATSSGSAKVISTHCEKESQVS